MSDIAERLAYKRIMKRKNDDDLRDILRAKLPNHGDKKRWANKNGILASTLSEVILGRKLVTEKMANALGYIYTKEHWVKKPKFD